MTVSCPWSQPHYHGTCPQPRRPPLRPAAGRAPPGPRRRHDPELLQPEPAHAAVPAGETRLYLPARPEDLDYLLTLEWVKGIMSAPGCQPAAAAMSEPNMINGVDPDHLVGADVGGRRVGRWVLLWGGWVGFGCG